MDTVDSGLPGGHSQAHWCDTWDRHTSQSFSNTTKGLQNAPGENNCFLNSAVQVFWHIDVFRRSYRRLSGHLCMGHSCIFCALKVIFTQFQFSDQSSLQPSGLRKALANTFAKQERFQLGHMDDAAECFENILNRIHYHIANTYNEDACNAPHCITHQKFAMTLFEQLVCPCGSMSEPLKYHEMVHYVSANALVSQSRAMQESGDTLHSNRFGLLLRNSRIVGDMRDCPGNCGKKVQIRRTLLNVPDVVSIGLVWGSDKVDPELTSEVTRAIGTTILFPDMFHSVTCKDLNMLPCLHLTSVVCYYGKHYSSFIYHTKLQEWIYFDDATVRKVGPNWEQVVDCIIRSRYQPLLLIYTNPNAQHVPTETAPSTRVMAPDYSMTPNKGTQEETKGQSSADINQSAPQSCRRSLTSCLEASEGCKHKANKIQTEEKPANEREPVERSSSFEFQRQSSFLLTVTKKGKEEAIYSVPHNNVKVINLQKDISQGDVRKLYTKQSSVSYCSDIPDGTGSLDCYNYTLSTSNQYRRPSFNTQDPNKVPLTPNFARMGDSQKKKGKGKILADVIRYHVDGTRRTSQSSDSDPSSPINGGVHNPPVSSINVKSSSYNVRSLSVDNTDISINTHTPVQSGLATLPRKKKPSNIISSVKPSSSTSLVSYLQQKGSAVEPQACNLQLKISCAVIPTSPYLPVGSQNVSSHYQNCLTYQNLGEQKIHSCQGSTSSILNQSTLMEGTITEDAKNMHSRQVSTTSQDTLTDNPKEAKSKSKKKDKDEKKIDEKKLKKEEYKHKREKQEKGTKVLDKPQAVQADIKSSSKDEGFSEDQSYIDRRMVKSVLNFQKLQRTSTSLSQTSTSNMKLDHVIALGGKNLITQKDKLSPEISFDASSLDSHKDSGYASSDRTSSSSTGSITMNPFDQYFLSRSMIPPRNLNNEHNAENLQKFMDLSVCSNWLGYTQEKDLRSLVANPNEMFYGNQTHTVGYCQPPNQNVVQAGLKKSHSHSFSKDLMSLPRAKQDQHFDDTLSGQEKVVAAHPPQVPMKSVKGLQNGLQLTTRSRNEPGTNMVPNNAATLSGVARRPTDRVVSETGNDHFQKLYQVAEDLMDSCVLMEMSEQYGNAMNYCQQAIDSLSKVMKIPNIEQSLYTYAQEMSNSYVIKMKSLQKHLLARQESSQSTNSSDSGISPDYRVQKQHGQSQLQVPVNDPKPPSRSNSQKSMDSLSATSSSSRSATPVLDKVLRPSTDDRVPSVDSHIPNREYHNMCRDRSLETVLPDPNANKITDYYETIPRKKAQKLPKNTYLCNGQGHNAEDTHKQSNVNHGRTNSGARTPVNELSYGDSRKTGGFVNQIVPATVVMQSRNFSEHLVGPLYRAAGPNLKPIPVAPPKLSSQLLLTEVGNQSLCNKETTLAGKQVWLKATNQNNFPAHGNLVDQKSFCDTQNDACFNAPSVSKLNSHIRNSNMASGKLLTSFASTEMAYSVRLQASHANQCTPFQVPSQQSTPDGKHMFQSGVAFGSQYIETCRWLDRSASFSHPSRSILDLYSRKGSDSIAEWPSMASSARRNGSSQPDLRKLTMDSVTVLQRPLTPQVLCSEPIEDCEHRTSVSVKDLLSRFECVTVDIELSQTRNSKTNALPTTNTVQLHPVNSVPFINTNKSSSTGLQRQRSKPVPKSLASMLYPQKPKSLLCRKSQNKPGNKPQKSVTFSTDICLVEAASNWSMMEGVHMNEALVQGDVDKRMHDTSLLTSLISVPTKSDEHNTSSSSSPVEAVGEAACTLCHKLGIEPGQNYCDKCTYYMNRFTPARQLMNL